MKIIHRPTVQVFSTQNFHMPEGFGDWMPSDSETDGVITRDRKVEDSDAIPEFSGRLCYLSFGKGEKDGHKTVNGRPDNSDYLRHIQEIKHGSVLEHTVIGLLFEGVSRSLTHELVRHRAGFGFSQLSQRYVDESEVAFVIPPEVQSVRIGHPLREVWYQSVEDAQHHYEAMLRGLMKQLEPLDLPKTEKLKRARQTARSVLPNAAETKIAVTGNARAWRHFVEQRGNHFADLEIRRLAVEVTKHLKKIAPNIFADLEISVREEDGLEQVLLQFSKV